MFNFPVINKRNRNTDSLKSKNLQSWNKYEAKTQVTS